MEDKNLLAIFKPGDETHYLIRDFIQSLQSEVRKVFDSFGYIGNLEENLKKFKKEDMRHFVILRSPTFDDLITEYFLTNPEAILTEIPDKLIVKIDYKQRDTDFVTGAREVIHFHGTIDEMLEKYKNLSSTNPKEILYGGLDKSEFLRKELIKKTLFGFGKRKLVPTYIAVGIETPDHKNLLDTTGAQGPYVCKLKK